LTRIHVAATHIFWKIIVAVHASRLNGVRPAISQPNASAQPLEFSLANHGLCCRSIGSAQSGTWVRKW
jgi:hypothetical protein